MADLRGVYAAMQPRQYLEHLWAWRICQAQYSDLNTRLLNYHKHSRRQRVRYSSNTRPRHRGRGHSRYIRPSRLRQMESTSDNEEALAALERFYKYYSFDQISEKSNVPEKTFMIYEDTSIQRGSEGLEKEINTQANELSNSKEDAERQSVTPAAQQDLVVQKLTQKSVGAEQLGARHVSGERQVVGDGGLPSDRQTFSGKQTFGRKRKFEEVEGSNN